MDSNGRLSIRWIYLGWLSAVVLLQLIIRAPVLTLSALALMAIVTALLFPDQIDEVLRFRKRGYRVWLNQAGLVECVYQERSHGRISFPAEQLDERRLLLSVPDDKDWPERTPNWARQRRAEILDRIVAELKDDYEVSFDYLDVAPEFPENHFRAHQNWDDDDELEEGADGHSWPEPPDPEAKSDV